MTLRFDGIGAGLGFRSPCGDRNDPISYVLVCKCGGDLGPLARFQPNKDGYRSARCLRCDDVVLVQGTNVIGVVPYCSIEDKKTGT